MTPWVQTLVLPNKRTGRNLAFTWAITTVIFQMEKLNSERLNHFPTINNQGSKIWLVVYLTSQLHSKLQKDTILVTGYIQYKDEFGACFYFFKFFSFIYMCIQCLGYFLLLSPALSLTPTPLPLPPTPSLPDRNYFALIFNFVEDTV
jgi:hypothetical protein